MEGRSHRCDQCMSAVSQKSISELCSDFTQEVGGEDNSPLEMEGGEKKEN